MDGETPLEDIDLTTIKARSVSGIVTLISRSFFLQLISIMGFALLSAFLKRPEIGLFIAVNDLVSILGYFSDIGLAASLIQKKQGVTVTDLRTTFTFQQILVITSVTFMLLFAPRLFAYYHVDESGTWLFYSLLLGFFLSSLKTIPSVVMERKLRFEILALVEIVETTVFYSIAVIMAGMGKGVTAYAWAVGARAVIGTILLYILAPWPVGIAFSKSSLKTLLSFGVPYQINSFIAVVKDRFLNIALWKIIGADGVGIIGWAQTWSQKPLRFVLDNVSKVTFPAFSRLQEHPSELKAALEKSLLFICILTFPAVAGIAAIGPGIVQIFPQYAKWEVALLPLTIYCFSSACAAVSTSITNVFNAIGKVKINSYLMIMWTALTWLLTPLFAIKFGYLGVAYATGIIALSSAVPVIIIRKMVPVNLWETVGKPAVATGIMAVFTWGMITYIPLSLFSLVADIFLSAGIYLGILYIFYGKVLLADLGRLNYAFRKK